MSIENIVDKIDIKEWLDEYGVDWEDVHGSGQVRIRECPFCGNTKSKVYIGLDNKRGICFHSDCPKKGFNFFSFAREFMGCSTKDTAKNLESFASRFGYRPPKPTGSGPIRYRTDGWELPESIPLPTESNLTHPYLIERRITVESQKDFGIRWCEEGKFPYTDVNGITRSMNFSNRIILPVFDLDGTLRTFQGRAVDDNPQRYLFPPTLPGTGKFLYGGNLVDGKETLVVGEGPFDVIATRQAIEGLSKYRNFGVVGSFGLSISHSNPEGDDQLGRLLKLKARGLKRIIIMWDGEQGAYSAALDAGMVLVRAGFVVSIATLPAGKDPAELYSSIVRGTIDTAQPLNAVSYVPMRLDSPYRSHL